jgi:hypothetical protein
MGSGEWGMGSSILSPFTTPYFPLPIPIPHSPLPTPHSPLPNYANLGFAFSGSISMSRIAWFTSSVLIFRSRESATSVASVMNL